MDKFTTVTGVAAPLPAVNMDTDKIIPARFLKTIKRTGLGASLFNDQRFEADGSEKPDFVLNQAPYRDPRVLVVGDNFGCGSSREHAPWALIDHGVRVVIGTTFADIFFNNSFKNGLLLITLPQDQLDTLMADAERGANAIFTVDLEAQEITRPDGERMSFDIDPFRKHCLLNALDDISLTLAKTAAIDAFETRQRAAKPWLYA